MKLKSQFLCLVILVVTFQYAKSQSPESSEPLLKLNHIAMYVHDLKQSTVFYENILKLKQIPEPFHDGKHTWFTIGAAGSLHLIQGAPASITRDKNDHLCFSVKSIDGFIANLNKHKVEYTNWPGTEKAPTVRVDGVKQIYFVDPDGHWIEINDDVKK
ncbi:MAG TPA: VOC family protein [Chryseolinea sp.]|nr:VOC family protein [Chryseolinea sp.]